MFAFSSFLFSIPLDLIKMTKHSQHVLDTLDIVFLGTIGLGTIAWFARHQIANRLFKSNSTEQAKPAVEQEIKAPKKERNFVKVMKEQVNIQKGYF